MKKVLLALLAVSTLTAASWVYAEDLPEIPADDTVIDLPPLMDPAMQAPDAN